MELPFFQKNKMTRRWRPKRPVRDEGALKEGRSPTARCKRAESVRSTRRGTQQS